jgi:hypothetical protein
MNSTIVSIGVFFVLYFLIRFAGSITLKIVGSFLVFLFAAGLLYYKGIGPFEKNHADPDRMREKYCEKENEHPHICSCIYQQLEKDIQARFNEDERKKLLDDRFEWAYVINRSLSVIKPKALECLKKDKAENEWRVFINDLLLIDNELYKEAGNLVNEQKERLFSSKEGKLERKEKIDKRYSEE